MILRSSLERLMQAGKISPGSVTDLASSIAAVAVRHGAPKPDISSPEAFKGMLLDARSIARPNPADGARVASTSSTCSSAWESWMRSRPKQ